MRWTPKGRRPPAAVRDALALEPGERVLAHALTDGGSSVVATNLALHLPQGPAFLRLPWERVRHATWRDGRLHVRETGGEEHQLRLSEPASVPEAVQERVTATIVANQHTRLPGGGGVRIIGRRSPLNGALRWEFLFDAGLDPRDAGLRAKAEQALDELRRQTGL
jgi:hypothetical protein